MSIAVIRATFECDGCAKQFKVDIDPAKRAWQRRQDVMSIAVDCLRGGMSSDGEWCSEQAGMHLCSECTDTADNIRADDDSFVPTEEDIKRALGAID